MSIHILGNVCDGNQYHPKINRRKACYKIHNSFKQSQEEWKGELVPTQNIGKEFHKLFKAVVNEI